mmetsp:Transcript_108007/g.186364  ORF Transcript_108007/g.186364 Transcript_108007/m.186364 type:complete len:237 (-) Transcript_108007:705-1415(-)
MERTNAPLQARPGLCTRSRPGEAEAPVTPCTPSEEPEPLLLWLLLRLEQRHIGANCVHHILEAVLLHTLPQVAPHTRDDARAFDRERRVQLHHASPSTDLGVCVQRGHNAARGDDWDPAPRQAVHVPDALCVGVCVRPATQRALLRLVGPQQVHVLAGRGAAADDDPVDAKVDNGQGHFKLLTRAEVRGDLEQKGGHPITGEAVPGPTACLEDLVQPLPLLEVLQPRHVRRGQVDH